MTDYMKINWADVRVDDVLMHENGDRMTVTLTDFSIEPSYILVGGVWRGAENLAGTGFTPYRRKPELPTEPGAYHDKNGNYWLLTHAGDWYDWSTQQQPKFFYDDPSTHAPFTRLVPMPSSDAVMEVVQRAEPMCMRERITDAVKALLRGGDDE